MGFKGSTSYFRWCAHQNDPIRNQKTDIQRSEASPSGVIQRAVAGWDFFFPLVIDKNLSLRIWLKTFKEQLLLVIIGKDSDVELQDLLVNLTHNKAKENVPAVDDGDKIRSWQASQAVASDNEVAIDSQERNISLERSDEGQLDSGSTTKVQEAPKKTKKKKAKNIKKESVDGLQNAEG